MKYPLGLVLLFTLVSCTHGVNIAYVELQGTYERVGANAKETITLGGEGKGRYFRISPDSTGGHDSISYGFWEAFLTPDGGFEGQVSSNHVYHMSFTEDYPHKGSSWRCEGYYDGENRNVIILDFSSNDSKFSFKKEMHPRYDIP